MMQPANSMSQARVAHSAASTEQFTHPGSLSRSHTGTSQHLLLPGLCMTRAAARCPAGC